MLKYISQTERPVKFSNKFEYADLSDYLSVGEWCKDYHRNHHPQDTGDMLYRWNIAVYQLESIPKLLSFSGGNRFNALEWAEATAAILVHSTAAFEAAIDGFSGNWSAMVDPAVTRYELRLRHPSHAGALYDAVVHSLPGITKQMLYRAMGRKKRFDPDMMAKLASVFLLNVMDLVAMDNSCYDIESAVTLVVDKLNNIELKSH